MEGGEPIDSLLRAFLNVIGVLDGPDVGFDVITCDDLSMAALTVESMPASFTRTVEGICSSSCEHVPLNTVDQCYHCTVLPVICQKLGSLPQARPQGPARP
jgi:hypothetical protein